MAALILKWLASIGANIGVVVFIVGGLFVLISYTGRDGSPAFAEQGLTLLIAGAVLTAVCMIAAGILGPPIESE